jgi:hypothetical protein
VARKFRAGEKGEFVLQIVDRGREIALPIGLRDLFVQRRQFALRLLHGDARFQPREGDHQN